MDPLSAIAFKMANLYEMGAERERLRLWWTALPKDKLLTTADLRPLVEAQLLVMHIRTGEAHAELSYIQWSEENRMGRARMRITAWRKRLASRIAGNS